MRSISVFLLRLILGGILIAHGYPKLFGGKGTGEKLSPETKHWLGETFVTQMEQGGIKQTAGWLDSIGTSNAEQGAWASGIAEFGGGVAILIGWQSRPAALANIFTQMVAINKVHKEQGLVNGFELNLALIGGLGVIAFAGPGKLTLG